MTDALPDGLETHVRNSRVAMTVGDTRLPDCPLVAVNEPFCRITGYGPDEMLGRNCRFLQPNTGAGPVRVRMHAFVNDGKTTDAHFLIPNIRKDGSRFLNLVYMSRLVFAGEDALILASQFDVGDGDRGDIEAYAGALTRDVQAIASVLRPTQWNLLANYNIIANSNALIARHRL
ncbi:PAS domain-containing protein [Silicimonas algicola]|uniref:PAS domain S-box-containing protein n=1 Tax=Silicimonas algicola TaxID=1826607 RepID=A0A316G7X1_9RHOB|nr:PAS domain-containing protein [Silicimonas algicola]AZQ68485.1 PAS domain-containing protein [Silicimonas algicola]PWK55810.1 PAS domain S-box-containing protein [Silicimonas algicola]